MEISLPKKELLRLVGRCQGVADRRSATPVLANVLLTSQGKSVHVAATDLYLAVQGETPAEVKRGGSVALPARDLFERLKAMPEGPITVSVGENSEATIRAGGSPRRYTLHGIPGSDFPNLPAASKDAFVLKLRAGDLLRLIQGTVFSISTDETRAHVNSALLECDDKILRMVTTDGHRLSKMELQIAGNQASATMLIPLKAIVELRRLMEEATAEKGDQEIQLRQSGPHAFFSMASGDFSVKLVDAQFPPYAQVIPVKSEKKLRAPRTAFADALKAVALAASDRTGGVRFELSKDKLKILSESPESGQGFDEVPVEYSGANVKLGFNAKYFLDVLGALEVDEIELSFSGELDPAVIRLPDNENTYVAVIMPMRI